MNIVCLLKGHKWSHPNPYRTSQNIIGCVKLCSRCNKLKHINAFTEGCWAGNALMFRKQNKLTREVAEVLQHERPLQHIVRENDE